MGFKKNLPDSLELLLDTMCNTFGGIMFIAISLVVLSQLVTQQQKAMSEQDISQAVIERLKQKIELIQNENMKLSKLALNVNIKTSNVSQKKKDAILRMKEAKERNLRAEDQFERLEIKLKENQEILKHLNGKIETIVEKIKNEKAKLSAKKQKYLKEKQILEEQIVVLRKKLKKIQPPTLRFAKLQSTERRPYWVILQQNKIYRLGDERNPVKGEVELKFLRLTQQVWLKTLTGTDVGEAPEEELTFLFKDVDKEKYFVNIQSDAESFSTLLFLRQFLRNKNFLCHWAINPSFKLAVSSNVEYAASE